MNYTLLLAYATTIALLIATPGPVVALVLNTASKQGLRTAFLTIIGTNLASLLLIGVAAIIISGLLTINIMLFNIISIIGCIYIGWLATNTLLTDLRSPRSMIKEEVDTFKKEPSSLLSGFLVGIANPKDIIFFVAFFPQFINVAPSLSYGIIILTLVWIMFDFLILLGYSLLINKFMCNIESRCVSIASGVFLLSVATLGMLYVIRDIINAKPI